MLLLDIAFNIYTSICIKVQSITIYYPPISPIPLLFSPNFIVSSVCVYVCVCICVLHFVMKTIFSIPPQQTISAKVAIIGYYCQVSIRDLRYN